MQYKNKSAGKKRMLNSICPYIFSKISASVSESVIIGIFMDLFSRETSEKHIGIIRSPIKKSVVFSRILGLRVYFAKKYESSILGGHIKKLYNTFLSLPLRTIAIFLITYGIVLSLGASISENGIKLSLDSANFLSGVAITAVSVMLFPSKKTIYEHILQSKFLSVFCGENYSLNKEFDSVQPRGYSSAFLAGLILGVVSFVVTPSKVLLFLTALLCTCVIFNYPEMGVLLTISFLPIISTAYVIYLVFITLISYLFKYFIGKRHFNTKDTDILIFLALAVLLTSGIFTVSGISGISHSGKIMLCLCAALLVSNLVRSTNTVLKCVSMLIGSTFAVCSFNLFLFIFQYTRISDELSLHFSVTDFIGVLNIFSGRNELGVFSAVTLPLIFSYALHTDKTKRTKYAVLLIMLVVNIIISGNPAAFTVSIISLLIVLTFKNKLWLLLAVPCIIFGKLISSVPRLILSFIGINPLNDTSMTVATNHTAILNSLSEYGLFGTGLGQLNIATSINSLTGGFTEFRSLFHSAFLTLGLFGLLFIIITVCVFLSKPFNYIVSCKYRDEGIVTVCTGLLSTCISFILMSLFTYTASDTRIVMLFVVCLALSASASRCSKNDHISEYIVREHINYQ